MGAPRPGNRKRFDEFLPLHDPKLSARLMIQFPYPLLRADRIVHGSCFNTVGAVAALARQETMNCPPEIGEFPAKRQVDIACPIDIN